MITTHSLVKVYKGDVQALRGVDLEIPGTGLFGLLGVNGAGKTTLMRILAGLLHPTDGQVRVLGNDVTTPQGKRAVQSVLGYLPQEFGAPPDLTAWEFLDYIAVLKGVTDPASRQRQVDRVVDLTRLSEVADRRIKTYSGGMKRRLGIAQALLGDPKLLIVDEPTAGLDPEERVRFRNLLAEVAQRCAVILSTHIVEDIGQSCGQMAVLWQGGVLFEGAPGDLVDRARGRVWTILMPDDGRPPTDLVTVSTRQAPDGTQYRVLGEPASDCRPVAVEPTLEDGYMWLMHMSRSRVSVRNPASGEKTNE
jgi:ABC-type multidrug transport system ATPase subunit